MLKKNKKYYRKNEVYSIKSLNDFNNCSTHCSNKDFLLCMVCYKLHQNNCILKGNFGTRLTSAHFIHIGIHNTKQTAQTLQAWVYLACDLFLSALTRTSLERVCLRSCAVEIQNGAALRYSNSTAAYTCFITTIKHLKPFQISMFGLRFPWERI